MAKKFNRDAWLMHQLRRLSLKYPPRIRALNKTKTTYYITSKKGTQVKRVSFTCESCGKSGLKSTEKQMDHHHPVSDERGFVDWNLFLINLFCEEDNWCTLCIPCHEKKTLEENTERFLFNKKTVDKTK